LAGVFRGIRTWFAGPPLGRLVSALWGLFSALDTNWHNRQFANETVKLSPQSDLGA